MMHEDILKHRLIEDLRSINLPVDEVDISIRPFSSTYYGRYFPVYDERRCRPKIYLYPYKNKKGDMYSYVEILKILIHEMVHHLQHTNPSFVRLKGVMHDTNFWKLYNRYLEKIGGVDVEWESNIQERENCKEAIV